MENLLVYLFPEVVRHTAHECALREVGYLGCRYQRVQLRVDGGGCVLPVDGDGLPLLENLAETFRKAFGRFPDHLPGEDIPDCILDHFRLFFTVVTGQLGEVLETETDSHLVASGGGYQVIDTTEIDGRKLVYDDGTLELPFLVYQLYNAAVVQSQCRRIDVLSVRIISHAKDFRVFGIVQVQCKIIAGHYPV